MRCSSAKFQKQSFKGALWRSIRQELFCKKGVVKISQNSQENTCARVSFLKKRLLHRCFSNKFAKILRTCFLTELLLWLLLSMKKLLWKTFVKSEWKHLRRTLYSEIPKTRPEFIWSTPVTTVPTHLTDCLIKLIKFTY